MDNLISLLTKYIFNTLILLLCSPLLLRVVLAQNKDSGVQVVTQYLSLIPGGIGVKVRQVVLPIILERFSESSIVNFGTIFSKKSAVVKGNVYIGVDCIIGNVFIGNDTIIGDHVLLLSGGKQHGFTRKDIPIRMQQGIFDKIIIADNVWIGSGAIIMASVGSGSIVAAGSVVIDEVDEFSIVAGNPAKFVRKR